ncbi:TPA: hypothetical protein VCA72_000706 [Streptococcus suis]|nr:hypothetical protein [Streptococcus suis]
MKKFSSILARVGQLLSAIFIVWLFVTSMMYQTVLLLDNSELARIYQLPLWLYLILLLIIVVFSLMLLRLPQISGSVLVITGLIFYLVLGLIMISSIDWEIKNDAYQVFINGRLFDKGDYVPFAEGGYLNKYPHQLGLLTFERLIWFLSLYKNQKIFFFINLVLVLLNQYYGLILTKQLFKNQIVIKIYAVITFLFLPQLFSIFFVYGILPGTFFATVGLVKLGRYLEQKRLGDFITCIMFLAISYIIRNNFIILFVAISIVLILYSIKEKSKRELILIGSIFTLSFSGNYFNKSYYEIKTSQQLNGLPKVVWLAMGLGNSTDSPRLPGWYDESVDNTYYQNNGDLKKIEKINRIKLEQNVSKLTQDESYATKFFLTKFVSTWSDGNFQTLWSGPSTFVKGEIKLKWIEDLYSGKGLFRQVIIFGHIVLIIIYLGLVLAITRLLASPIQDNLFALIPVFYLVGGILFHLVWETKSQYAYPYIILALPVSAYGLYLLGYLGVRLRQFGQWYLRHLLQVFSRNN